LGAALGDEPAGADAELRIDARVRAAADAAGLALRFQGSTASECRAWQAQFAAKLKSLLGPSAPPERWTSVVERCVELDDHVREERLLRASGLPPLPLHLLVPRDERKRGTTSSGRRPGIVALHGHGRLGYDAVVGKGETAEAKREIASSSYDYARKLVARGYVVAAPCLTPFGRRAPAPNPRAREADACGPAFLALQYLGKLLIAENLRDVLWTVEFLRLHERVDPERIGCVGLSYGGRMTMLASALEPRIRVAVISGALNCFQERVATGHSGGCQVIPGLLNYGDVPEIASLIAPRPCLWEVGSRDDLIDPKWAEIALGRIRLAYRALDCESNLRVDRFNGVHEWHGTEAYELLDSVLKSSR
jgi:dienelactone hydrolase